MFLLVLRNHHFVPVVTPNTVCAFSRRDHKCSHVAPFLELFGVHADDATGQDFPDPTGISEKEPSWPKMSISKIDLVFICEIEAFEKGMCTLPSMDFCVKGIEQASVIFSETHPGKLINIARRMSM